MMQVDPKKPSWNDDIHVSDIESESAAGPSTSDSKKRKREKKSREVEEDEGVDVDMMDADNLPPQEWNAGGDDEEWDGTEEMRKRKLDEYMEELYKLEFNDLVRFSFPPIPLTN
jgi:protein KRI1